MLSQVGVFATTGVPAGSLKSSPLAFSIGVFQGIKMQRRFGFFAGVRSFSAVTCPVSSDDLDDDDDFDDEDDGWIDDDEDWDDDEDEDDEWHDEDDEDWDEDFDPDDLD